MKSRVFSILHVGVLTLSGLLVPLVGGGTQSDDDCPPLVRVVDGLRQRLAGRLEDGTPYYETVESGPRSLEQQLDSEVDRLMEDLGGPPELPELPREGVRIVRLPVRPESPHAPFLELDLSELDDGMNAVMEQARSSRTTGEAPPARRPRVRHSARVDIPAVGHERDAAVVIRTGDAPEVVGRIGERDEAGRLISGTRTEDSSRERRARRVTSRSFPRPREEPLPPHRTRGRGRPELTSLHRAAGLESHWGDASREIPLEIEVGEVVDAAEAVPLVRRRGETALPEVAQRAIDRIRRLGGRLAEGWTDAYVSRVREAEVARVGSGERARLPETAAARRTAQEVRQRAASDGLPRLEEAWIRRHHGDRVGADRIEDEILRRARAYTQADIVSVRARGGTATGETTLDVYMRDGSHWIFKAGREHFEASTDPHLRAVFEANLVDDGAEVMDSAYSRQTGADTVPTTVEFTVNGVRGSLHYVVGEVAEGMTLRTGGDPDVEAPMSSFSMLYNFIVGQRDNRLGNILGFFSPSTRGALPREVLIDRGTTWGRGSGLGSLIWERLFNWHDQLIPAAIQEGPNGEPPLRAPTAEEARQFNLRVRFIYERLMVLPEEQWLSAARSPEFAPLGISEPLIQSWRGAVREEFARMFADESTGRPLYDWLMARTRQEMAEAARRPDGSSRISEQRVADGWGRVVDARRRMLEIRPRPEWLTRLVGPARP